MERERWVAPAALQSIDMAVVDGVGSIDGTVKSVQAEIQRRVRGFLVLYCNNQIIVSITIVVNVISDAERVCYYLSMEQHHP